MATETKTFYPQAHVGAVGYSISNATNPVGKGASNTSYARIAARRSTNDGESYCYWPFDVSVIPSEATIDSVICKVKAKLSNNDVAEGFLWLFSGDVEKGSDILITETSETIYTLQHDIWTRSELSYIRLSTRINSPSTSTRYLDFYGADLIVTYSCQSEKFMLKLDGAWHDVARVFKKVNGVWVEVDDLSTAVDTSKKLVNGGQIR